MNELLEAALRYAAHGWYVFPIKPGQKVPLTQHGVKDATTDPCMIHGWWTKWPDANIAVACGKASGVYVVDVDVTEGGKVNGYDSIDSDLFTEETVQQLTPRGGCHLFYKSADPPANKNSFLPGVDIRGDGYYVLLAPSIHSNGKQYVWVPCREPWNMGLAEYPDFLRPTKRATGGVPTPPAPAPVSTSHTDTLRRASLYLAQCDPAIQGQAGHDKLLWACGCMTCGYELSESQAFDILAREYNPRCIPPWDLGDKKDAKDFRRKIAQSIQKPPDKPRGWLLRDDGYTETPITVTDVDVQALIVNAGLAPADSLRGVVLPSSVPEELHMTPEDSKAILDQFKQELPSRQFTSTPLDSPNPYAAPSNAAELRFLTQPTGLYGEICSWINETAFKPQPYLTLGCVLAFLGVLFGRKVKDYLGSRTNLYCMSVAHSSAGKAHAMNKIRELCIAADCVHLLGGCDLASDTAIESRMEKEPATLFLLDEIGHLLVHIKSGTSRHHAQIISTLMQLYSAAPNIYLGREYADAENQRTITQPCCCIYGVATPDKFSAGLSTSELKDGWLSRCLVFYDPSEPRKLRDKDLLTPPPKRVVDLVSAWAKRVVDRPAGEGNVSQFVVGSADGFREPPPEQIIIPTEASAEQRFRDFDDMAELSAKESDVMSRSWLKAEENARRIALIIACSDSYDKPTIDISAADRACRMVSRIVADFGTYVAPEIADCKVETDKQRVINVIEKHGAAGCLKRDITRSTRPFLTKYRNDLLADLQESGEVVCRSVASARTVRYWTAEHCPPQEGGGNDE